MRFVLSFKKNWCNVAILSAFSILDFLREEIWMNVVLLLLFVDAINSLSTVILFKAFGFLMLQIYHFVIGSHFHDLVAQNVLILDALLYSARILFRHLPMLVGRVDVRFALDLFESHALRFLSIDYLERAQSWRWRISDTHRGTPRM